MSLSYPRTTGRSTPTPATTAPATDLPRLNHRRAGEGAGSLALCPLGVVGAGRPLPEVQDLAAGREAGGPADHQGGLQMPYGLRKGGSVSRRPPWQVPRRRMVSHDQEIKLNHVTGACRLPGGCCDPD